MCENKEEYSALKQAAIQRNRREMDKHKKDIPKYEYSKRFKRKMNRLGREKVGLKNALHPEVANAFERARSKIVCWWNALYTNFQIVIVLSVNQEN